MTVTHVIVPVPSRLIPILAERGGIATAIVRILEQVLGQEVVPPPEVERDG